MSLFGSEEFRVCVSLGYPQIEAALPGRDAPHNRLISDAIAELNRHGLIDARFFDWLAELRPRRADEIELVRRAWLANEPEEHPPLENRADELASAAQDLELAWRPPKDPPTARPDTPRADAHATAGPPAAPATEPGPADMPRKSWLYRHRVVSIAVALVVLSAASLALYFPESTRLDPCKAVVDKQQLCAASEDRQAVAASATTLAVCRSGASIDVAREEVACVPYRCGEFKDCLRAVAEHDSHAHLVRRIRSAVDGDVKRDEALTECLMTTSTDPTLASLCLSLFERNVARLTRTVRDIRDELSPDTISLSGAKRDGWDECSELLAVAGRLDAATTAQAEALCDELAAARLGAEAAEAARRNIKDGVNDLPLDCDMAAKRLAVIDAAWARRQFTAVIDDCYGSLGTVILAGSTGMRCDVDVDRVIDALKKYRPSDPGAGHTPTCTTLQ
ncbi:hypothetical protein [Nannocystis punicea]|uniref:Lysozyme inhibitor LprI N-terminal domain-containing protein n=1 Tax=Nannocystis punicea TaxID=2995304 RepID=A0ABY7GX04_9BACT|nr:hypothetical protein [Nannocystis poenicansa]WAS91491.1 hypothetical protein O0S08_35355 [Nannocystis poenicansa]